MGWGADGQIDGRINQGSLIIHQSGNIIRCSVIRAGHLPAVAGVYPLQKQNTACILVDYTTCLLHMLHNLINRGRFCRHGLTIPVIKKADNKLYFILLPFR